MNEWVYLCIERWPFESYLNDIYVSKKDVDLYRKCWNKDIEIDPRGSGEKKLYFSRRKIKDYRAYQGRVPRGLWCVVDMFDIEGVYIKKPYIKGKQIMFRTFFTENKIRKWWGKRICKMIG